MEEGYKSETRDGVQKCACVSIYLIMIVKNRKRKAVSA